MSDVDPAVQGFYNEVGPLTFAERSIGEIINLHLEIMHARHADPAAFPDVDPSIGVVGAEADLAALSRRILGLLLELGWSPP
jgi:hypothetical protein